MTLASHFTQDSSSTACFGCSLAPVYSEVANPFELESFCCSCQAELWFSPSFIAVNQVDCMVADFGITTDHCTVAIDGKGCPA